MGDIPPELPPVVCQSPRPLFFQKKTIIYFLFKNNNLSLWCINKTSVWFNPTIT